MTTRVITGILDSDRSGPERCITSPGVRRTTRSRSSGAKNWFTRSATNRSPNYHAVRAARLCLPDAGGTASMNRRTSGTRSESLCHASAIFQAASGRSSS
jgi:hypothetical protein